MANTAKKGFSPADLIKEQKILKAKVVACNRNGKKEILTAELYGDDIPPKKFVSITRGEVERFFISGSSSHLVGEIVPVVLLSEEDGVLYASRKKAIEKLFEAMADDLAQGRFLEGRVANVMDYGAFVEVNGLMGLLKNVDATIDRSYAKDHLKRGDKVRVRCSEVTKDYKIFWQLAEEDRFRRKDPVRLDFAIDSVLLGTVTYINDDADSPHAFVKVIQGIDVYTVIPFEAEIHKGTEVAVRVTAIKERPGDSLPWVRGRIERIF